MLTTILKRIPLWVGLFALANALVPEAILAFHGKGSLSTLFFRLELN